MCLCRIGLHVLCFVAFLTVFLFLCLGVSNRIKIRLQSSLRTVLSGPSSATQVSTTARQALFSQLPVNHRPLFPLSLSRSSILSGVLEATRIRKEGYSWRPDYSSFVRRYKMLAFPITKLGQVCRIAHYPRVHVYISHVCMIGAREPSVGREDSGSVSAQGLASRKDKAVSQARTH